MDSPFPEHCASQLLANERGQSKYLAASPLPRQLLEYCKIHLEERLYTQAINLLSSVLTAPLSIHVDQPDPDLPTLSTAPAHVPPFSFTSLLATIAIHPSLTSPNASPERLASADAALNYLHKLNSIVGPVNAQLNCALQFKEQRRGGGRRNGGSLKGHQHVAHRDSDADNALLSDEEELCNDLSTRKSIWVQAQDFWHVIGWSFNCAAQHPARWTRLKLWLELMLNVLEDDWTERLRLGTEREDTEYTDEVNEAPWLRASLLVRLVGSESGLAEDQGKAGLRRIMRALFANGNDKEMNEFGEVWEGETRENVKRKPAENPPSQLRKINIEEGEFGDYFGEDSSDDGQMTDTANTRLMNQGYKKQRSARKRTSSSNPDMSVRASADASTTSHDTGISSYRETLPLRRRLIGLLLRLSAALPSHFTNHDILIDMLEEHIRPLPLAAFVAVTTYYPETMSLHLNPTSMSDSSPQLRPLLPASSHISLLQEIARIFLAASGSIANTRQSYYLTQAVLESAYLPFAAGRENANNAGPAADSIVANAKLSLCCENMMRLLHANVELTAGHNSSLREAVEKGIKARKVRGTHVNGAGEDKAREAKRWLESSAASLRMLVRLIEFGPGGRSR